MTVNNLQTELEQVLMDIHCEACRLHQPKLDIERAIKAILATVSKHLPEKKDTTIYKGSYTLDEMDDPINNTHGLAYCNGRNTAITEMEKKLTPADKE